MALSIPPELSSLLIKDVDGLNEENRIGTGAYGAAYRVTVDGVRCIAKRILAILQNEHVPPAEKAAAQQMFVAECVRLSKLRHPNIVHFIGVHYQKGLSDLSLIMECLEMDLGYCLDTRPNIPLSIKLSILQDVAYGLLYMHTHNPPMIHRDLSANNVFLTKHMTAKIGDLGVSKLLDVRKHASTKAPGTLYYMPPEALRPNPSYDTKLDIFSFGHLTLYVATQQFPQVHEVEMTPSAFQNKTTQILKRGEAFAKMGKEHPLHDVAYQCLQDSPNKRPSTLDLQSMLYQLCSKHPKSLADIEATVNAEDHGPLQHPVVSTNSASSTPRAEAQKSQEEPPELSKRRRSTRGSASSEAGHEIQLPSSICPSTVILNMDDLDDEVNALCFSSYGHLMATGGTDKIVRVWSVNESKETVEFDCALHGSTGSITSVQFDHHHHARIVLATSTDYIARVWTIQDQKQVHTLTGHSNKVMSAKFLGSSHKVVTGSLDRTIKIWDLHNKTCFKTLLAGSSCNDVIAAKEAGTVHVMSAHIDRRVRFWDLRSDTANEIVLNGIVTSLDILPEKHLLLCCSRENSLYLIDLRQNSITAKYTADKFSVGSDCTKAVFSPDGRFVAAGSADGSIFLWDISGHKTPRVRTVKEHSKEVMTCAWHPKGRLFASADKNKTVLLWREYVFPSVSWNLKM